jgi:hypothetical protein
MPDLTIPQIVSGVLLQTVVYAFFCMALYKALMMVRESNRAMQPALVWLLVIPGFVIVWNFIVVRAMTISLNKEFTDRDFEIEKSPGLTYGMLYAGLSVVYIPLVLVPSLIVAAALVNLLSIIFFVMYWLKINWYRRVLEKDEAESESIDPQDET